MRGMGYGFDLRRSIVMIVETVLFLRCITPDTTTSMLFVCYVISGFCQEITQYFNPLAYCFSQLGADYQQCQVLPVGLFRSIRFRTILIYMHLIINQLCGLWDPIGSNSSVMEASFEARVLQQCYKYQATGSLQITSTLLVLALWLQT